MKIKNILFVLMLSLLIIPFSVFAEDNENNEANATNNDSSNEVIVYFFNGQGCSHCAEAEEWFNSIEEEYGSKFMIADYETWYNQENAQLMEKVAISRGEEEKAKGVPYIIIGDQSWSGFDEGYKEEILDKINSMYEQDVADRYDALAHIDTDDIKSKNSLGDDIVSLIVMLIAVGGIGYGIYYARKKTN